MCVCAETCQARDNDTEMCPYMSLYGPYVSIYVHMCPYMDIYVHMCPYMDTYGTYKDIYGHTYQNTCVLIRPIYVHICPICVLICPICPYMSHICPYMSIFVPYVSLYVPYVLRRNGWSKRSWYRNAKWTCSSSANVPRWRYACGFSV